MFKLMRLCTPLANSVRFKPRFHSRTFLSESFECREAWEKRLESPLLQKVKLDDMYYELDNKFNQINKASAIDIDIFANAVKDGSHLEEIEDLVHKLRLSCEAGNILPSTHHALIRAFLNHGNVEELLRILNDRLNYGIFTDNYCSLLMMDNFIKADNFRDAAKVAVLHMLQEDFSTPLIQYLSLYSCHKYLLNPTEWEKPEPVEEKPEDDEEEEVRIRVKFIRNPFFDDHFDLRSSDELIGKTLVMIGNLLNDQVGMTYRLIGWGLFKKWDIAKADIENIINVNQKVYKEAVTMFKECLAKLPPKECEEAAAEQKLVEDLQLSLNKLESSGLLVEGNLINIVEEKVKSFVTESESKLIQEQIQTYEDWENNREDLLRRELEEMRRLKRLDEVKKKKEELAKREQELFFFEKEDELDLEIENKKVPYPKKWLGKKKAKHVQGSEYVPPEIVKKSSRL